MLTRRRRAGRGAPMATTRPTVAAPSSAGRTTLIRVAPFGPEAGPATRGPAAARAPRVTVQGGFSLRTPDNGTVPLVGEARRLLALLALRGNMVHRTLVAGQLWSEVTERRAHSSLRSALARLPVQARTVVVISPAEVGLTDGVTIDLRESRALADRLLLTPGGCPDADDCSARAVGMLSTDLLPGWDEDWASCEAEQWHQVRMHALEAMADHLVGMGRFGAAVESAMWAIRADPFRESGHAALIRVHLAEGNQSEALRQFATHRELIVDELGLEPTPRLRALVFSSR